MTSVGTQRRKLRYQVLNHILSLYETANDKMWSMLEAAAKQGKQYVSASSDRS